MSKNHNDRLPCCHCCQWSSNFDIETFSVQCRRHKMQIRGALSTFCADFENVEHDFNPASEFERGVIYDWVEVACQDAAASGKEVIRRACAPLAHVGEYGDWSEDQEYAIRLNLIDQVTQKTQANYGAAQV